MVPRGLLFLKCTGVLVFSSIMIEVKLILPEKYFLLQELSLIEAHGWILNLIQRILLTQELIERKKFLLQQFCIAWVTMQKKFYQCFIKVKTIQNSRMDGKKTSYQKILLVENLCFHLCQKEKLLLSRVKSLPLGY